jgi:hypothetical protein
VLCTGGVLAAHSVFAASLAFDAFVGRVSFWVSCVGAILGWVGLIPYYYYVLQFLNPETIIERVKASILAELELITAGKRDTSTDQRELSKKIAHLGSVILQSVNRSDRDTTIEAIRAMAQVIRTYDSQIKPRVSPQFLMVDQDIFTGFSRAAIEIVNRDRVWVEQKCLQQFELAYNGALSKMADAVSTISDVVKDLANERARAGDRETLGLYVRFMNTFVREAIHKKDVHAIYDVFYQYRSLARKLMDTHPDVARDMVGYFKYYADMARLAGMAFIYELASYELADLCELAYEHDLTEAAQYTLKTLLSFQGVESSARLVKSRAILGGYLLTRNGKHHGDLIALARSLRGVPKPLIAQAGAEIISTTNRVFWEVTDRQVNFDYVDDIRKAKVRQFLDAMSAVPSAEAAGK